MKRRLLLALLASISLATAEERWKVATLHPLLGDLAHQVGGERVEVINLLKPGGDIHHFEPTASDLRAMKGAKLVLASGKNLESYLPKLRDNLTEGQRLIEVGRTIPSLKMEPGSEVFACCPQHAKGGVDPHWWHGADNMIRAAKVLADEFSKEDPAGKDVYQANQKVTAKRFADLKRWAQMEIARIPKKDRKLVTAHAAFGYFCKDYGFQMVPLLGLAREDDASPKYLSESIQVIREKKIRAAFPEDQANPKILSEITRQTGLSLGRALIADGTSAGSGSTFEGMTRHNVSAIVEALAPKP